MKQRKTGFVLPLVVVSGTILLLILAYVMRTLSVNQQSLINQHMQLLARQAAESGLARVQQCVRDDKENVSWDGSKPIQPNTDCKGIIKTGFPKYVTETDKYRTFFEVRPIDIQDDFRNMSAVGKLEILRKTGSIIKVVRTYNYTLSAHIKTDLTFEDVVFGSLYVGSGYNDLYSRGGQPGGFSRSVYFFTKTHSGRISSVGYNMDGVLTGYKNNNIIPWAHRYISDPKIQYELPYHLPNPKRADGSPVPIKRIITDFQGNGWVAFFMGYDGRTIYGTGSNLNCDLGTGLCNSAESGIASRPIWEIGQSKMDLSNIPVNQKIIDIKYNASTYLLTDKGKIYYSGKASFGPGAGAYISNSWANKPTIVTGNGIENKIVKKLYTDAHYVQSSGSIVVAVTDDGELYAWGNGNAAHGIGLNQIPQVKWKEGKSSQYCIKYKTIFWSTSCVKWSPKIESGKIVDAVTDGGTIWALDSRGVVWSIGNNQYGQLGTDYDKSYISEFRPINFYGKKITKIVADAYSALFLTEDGEVYGVGLNNKSQLGFPITAVRCGGVPCSKTPGLYELPYGKKAKDIFIVSPGIYGKTGANYITEADNYRNSFVVTTDGEVYGAGSNKHGQLGVGSACDGQAGYDPNPREYDKPQKMILNYKNNDSGVVGDENKVVRAKYVRSGIGTTIVITDLNYVFTVGNNTNGQLGSGDTKECHVPKRHRYTNVFQTWYY
ncbi:MAG: hypothetical protein Q3996_01520 [Candidatus Saccharibacteria bacterium]|nr:hypothetical protein [Candidatus Saccharibacteria bacterium]